VSQVMSGIFLGSSYRELAQGGLIGNFHRKKPWSNCLIKSSVTVSVHQTTDMFLQLCLRSASVSFVRLLPT